MGTSSLSASQRTVNQGSVERRAVNQFNRGEESQFNSSDRDNKDQSHERVRQTQRAYPSYKSIVQINSPSSMEIKNENIKSPSMNLYKEAESQRCFEENYFSCSCLEHV